MTKPISNLLSALCLLLLVGCSHISKVGHLEARRPDGSTNRLDFHKVQATSLLGPSQTAVFVTDRATGAITPVLSTTAGNGLGPALVGAGGLVGAAATLGHSIEPDRTTVTSHGGAGGAAQATGGSATATAPRTGFPPGHNKDKPNKGR